MQKCLLSFLKESITFIQ